MITYKVENMLCDFEFWGGAVELAKVLTWDEFSIIEDYLREFIDLTDVAINDMFWFEGDIIAEMIGFPDLETLLNSRIE